MCYAPPVKGPLTPPTHTHREPLLQHRELRDMLKASRNHSTYHCLNGDSRQYDLKITTRLGPDDDCSEEDKLECATHELMKTKIMN